MIPYPIAARALGTASPNQSLMTVKNTLGWLFAAAFVVIVCAVFILRIRFLRARNRPLQDFFTFMEAPRRRGSLSHWSARPGLQSRSSRFTPVPLQGLQGSGRGRRADINSRGRQLGGSDPSEASGGLTESDTLPAYEAKGGPPNYPQFLAVDLGTGANALHQRPGMTDQSAQPSHGLDAQLPHPPPPSYIRGTATI